MTLVDQFESVFRSADRRRYRYDRPELRRVVVIHDLEDADEAERFLAATRKFLIEAEGAAFVELGPKDFEDVEGMKAAVEEHAPDLVVSYRNVRYGTWQHPYSLGVYLNVLTRETDLPVLVVPNPHEVPDLAWAEQDTDEVMVLTDHLVGDDRLVNFGARLTRPGGQLFLAHLEDDAVFDRYMEVIGRLPSIDTTVAEKDIKERLLKEPLDYVASCREVLAEQGHLTHEVIPVVRMGHTLADYAALLEEHRVDLLIFHTKEEDDLALHGKAFSLATRLRDLPLLML